MYAYRNSQTGVIEPAVDLTDFQYRLLDNRKEDVIIGKQRNQRVTTTLAYCAFKQAVEDGKSVAVFMDHKRYKGFLEKLQFCLSDTDLTVDLEINSSETAYSFRGSGGKIFRYQEKQRFDTGIFDEFGYNEMTILKFQNLAVRCENFLVSFTLQENFQSVNRVFKKELGKMFKLLYIYRGAEYIEASDSTMFTKSDIKKFQGYA